MIVLRALRCIQVALSVAIEENVAWMLKVRIPMNQLYHYNSQLLDTVPVRVHLHRISLLALLDTAETVLNL